MNIFDVAFLIIPVAALVAKESGKLKLSTWSIFIIYVAVGWLLAYLGMERYFASLDELIRSPPNPSEELLSKWQNDGASQVFALYLGWVYAAVYFLFCLSIVYVVRTLRKRR